MMKPLPLNVHLNVSLCCREPHTPWVTSRGYPIERCRGCGSAFVNPRPSTESLRDYYVLGGHGKKTFSSIEEVLKREADYPNSTIDARRIVDILKRLAPGDRMLDVGSGYGFYAREARERGFDVDAIEPAPFERRCTEAVAGIEPQLVSFEEFQAEDASYDAILMSQILEHAVDARGWIRRAWGLLRMGGILAVALPNFNSIVRLLLGRRDPMVHPPDHLNYFNQTGLTRLLRDHSMTIKKVCSISRLPGSALTDRVVVPAALARPTEYLVQTLQRPVLWPFDRLGLGMFLNVFAIRGTET